MHLIQNNVKIFYNGIWKWSIKDLKFLNLLLIFTKILIKYYFFKINLKLLEKIKIFNFKIIKLIEDVRRL